MLSWLRSLFRKHAPLEHLEFRMYTRAGCHLCEDAWKLLEAEKARYGFQLEAVDVDTDSELKKNFGDWVPVVTVNNEVRFRGGVNPVLLRRLLEAEMKRNHG